MKVGDEIKLWTFAEMKKKRQKKSIIEWFSANFYRAQTQRGTTEYCQGTGWQVIKVVEQLDSEK